MEIFSTFWWLFFFTAVGLCAGSFLNAVIFRLPRERSLRNPLWSFCPACEGRIRWYDNLPVISFILLRGRCRRCRAPIPTRYLVVEVSMALIVLLLLDAFFLGQTRAGISTSPFGLTDQLASDWPIFTAHIILFACLLSMSAIDLEHYWVDIRFTNFAAAAGFVLHTLWTPRDSMEWHRPYDTTAVMAIFATTALVLLWLVSGLFRRREPMLLVPPGPMNLSHPPPDQSEVQAGNSGSAAEALPSEQKIESEPSPDQPALLPPPCPSRFAGWMGLFLLIALAMVLLFGTFGAVDLKHPIRAVPVLVLFFLLIVWESKTDRTADQEIELAIHEERHYARRMVLGELAWLLPVVAAGAVGWYLMARVPGFTEWAQKALQTAVSLPGPLEIRQWMPLMGLATAASGFVLAGALGWAVRIVFTLVFGKEAFGTGDIHLMAAAGCVAGWPVVILGFFLTCGLALVGWVATLPFKRTRALPLGPWLSLSFLIIVLFYDSIVQWPLIDRAIQTINMLILQNSQVPGFERLR